MSQFLRLLKSKFAQEEEVHSVLGFINYAEGNRVGYPAEVVAFDYNHEHGLALVATKFGDVVVYGARGVTWSITLVDPNKKPTDGYMQISKCLFIDVNIILVLCRGGQVIKLKLMSESLGRLGDVTLNLDLNFNWDVTYIQKCGPESNYLVFGSGGNLIRMKCENLEYEVIIDAAEWQKWIEVDKEDPPEILSINSDPDNANTILAFIANGQVGLYRDRKLRGMFRMINSDGSPVKKIQWNPTKKLAYAFGDNNKFTKWKIEFGSLYETFPKEVEGLLADQAGPYPCDHIEHFNAIPDVKEPGSTADILAYLGGKSCVDYNDRTVVTIRHKNHIVGYEVNGDIINIVAVRGEYDGENKQGIVMIVTTAEIIGIDLETEDWKSMRPYVFFSLNNSTLTSQYRVLNIEENVWERVMKASENYWKSINYSCRQWPLKFMEKYVIDCSPNRAAYRQIHLTGHSSGDVILWESGGLNMKPMCIIRTGAEFIGYVTPNKSGARAYEDEVESGVPLAKIGDYDPFEDDENLTITQLFMDPKKGTIIATNRGGFIMMYDLYDTESTFESCCPKKFPWESPSRSYNNTIIPRNNSLRYPAGFQPTHKDGASENLIIQTIPNLDITQILFVQKYNCLAIGSDSGFMFLDTRSYSMALSVPYHHEEGAQFKPDKRVSRYKSLKKSLRRTFRRKKRGDGDSSVKEVTLDSAQSGTSVNSNTIRRSMRSTRDESANRTGIWQNHDKTEGAYYVERQIEARDDLPDSSPGWIVTCMKYMRLPVTSKNSMDDVILIGTSGGKVLFYKIKETIDSAEDNFEVNKIDAINMGQHQTVINLDLSCEDGFFNSTTSRLVVFTDEQIRLFSFPGKQKTVRYKLTANEGIRIRRGVVVKLTSPGEDGESDLFAVVIANDGNLRVHSLVNPAVFHQFQVLSQYDMMGFTSSILTQDGQLSHIKRWSEIFRHTINQKYRGWKNGHPQIL